jgi:selenocysteine lyase/cysteine desulfurase
VIARWREVGPLDGNLRLAVHFYNHEDDIDQVARVLAVL